MSRSKELARSPSLQPPKAIGSSVNQTHYEESLTIGTARPSTANHVADLMNRADVLVQALVDFDQPHEVGGEVKVLIVT